MALVWAVTLLLSSSMVVWASATHRFVFSRMAHFRAGKFEATAVDAHGVLQLSAKRRRHALKGVQVAYAVAPGPAGVVDIGTAQSGQIFRLQGGNVRQLADTGGAVVTALCRAFGGVLVAAVAPGGRLVQLDAHGKVKP
ncbi:MAG: hypothetical protein ACPGUV_06000, partial [Polyangiales bacterium]